MTGKATVTRTRSGNLRGSIDPQALAREVEALKSDLGGIKKVLAPAFAAPIERIVTQPAFITARNTIMAPGWDTPAQGRPEPDIWARDHPEQDECVTRGRLPVVCPEEPEAGKPRHVIMVRLSQYDALRNVAAHQGTPVRVQCPDCAREFPDADPVYIEVTGAERRVYATPAQAASGTCWCGGLPEREAEARSFRQRACPLCRGSGHRDGPLFMLELHWVPCTACDAERFERLSRERFEGSEYATPVGALEAARQKVMACTECAQEPRRDPISGRVVLGEDGQPVMEGTGRVFRATPAPKCSMCQGTGQDPMHTPPGELWRTGTGELVRENIEGGGPLSYQSPGPVVYGPDPPAMAQQAARDNLLNDIDRRAAEALAARNRFEQGELAAKLRGTWDTEGTQAAAEREQEA